MRWMLKSPKKKTFAHGLIKRTSYMLDEIESKTMHRDEKKWLIEEKEVRHEY